MVDVTGVRFKSSGKVYYFDPCDFELKPGMGVIVETARGMEFGTVTMNTTPVNEEDITHPLKKIIRIADEKDHARHKENEKKKSKAMKVCQEKIQKHRLEMKLIDVEYTFDNNKIIFYFTADGRVDFRDLVKDLAGVFKMRIELRQIGVRDEAKMLGGVGSCGRGLCCASWLPDFQPVSIKMAKVQNLSLNPAKISGVCGRLMCCLKYENDVYLELRQGMPDVNEKVMTEDGLGKVIESDVLSGRLRVRLYTGEKDDNGNDKLGADILTLAKDDVERIGKKKNDKPAPSGAVSKTAKKDTLGVQQEEEETSRDKNAEESRKNRESRSHGNGRGKGKRTSGGGKKAEAKAEHQQQEASKKEDGQTNRKRDGERRPRRRRRSGGKNAQKN